MPVDYPQNVIDTYSDCRRRLEGVEVTTAANTKRLGAESMTKQCFACSDYPGWVCLVVTESKRRLLEAEVAQLLEIGQTVPIPYLGPGNAVGQLVFECTRKGEKAYGFLQMRFGAGGNGRLIETKVQHDESGNWLHNEVLGSLASEAELTDVKQFIELLLARVERADVPDLQVAFDTLTRRLYLFDPGDPENWGSLQDKHLRILRKWQSTAKHYRLKSAKAGASPASAAVAPRSAASHFPALMVQSAASPSSIPDVKSAASPFPALVVKSAAASSPTPMPPSPSPMRASASPGPAPAKSPSALPAPSPRPPSPRASSAPSAAASAPPSPGPSANSCQKCGAAFPSSVQLSRHRFTSGHHV